MNSKITIDFYGMTYRKRLSVWWDFTKAVLFKKNVKMKEKVPEINVIAKSEAK